MAYSRHSDVGVNGMSVRSLISEGFVAVARPGGEELERRGVGQSSPGRCKRLREAAGGELAGTFGDSSGVARPEWTLWREVSGPTLILEM